MGCKSTFTALGASLLCCACASSVNRVPPEQSIPMPVAYEQATDTGATFPSKDWYRGFGSDELVQLMQLAEENNLDLAAAKSRILQANARARGAGAVLLPQLDAGVSATQTNGRARGVTANETDWSALFSASYELDFWGRNRATATAAREIAAASQADHSTLGLTVMASVANSYFALASLREREKLAADTLESMRRVLAVIDARHQAGAATDLALAAQKAAVANAELALPQLQQQQIEMRGALAVLVGRAPEGFSIQGASLEGLAEPAIAPGLPAELLLRRPDILAAELNLRAARADVAAARAAMFPSITLTGSGGLQHPAVQAAVTTLAGTGYSLTLGASLVHTIFDGGRRRALRDEADAHELELIASYRSAILNALLDVETALATIQHLDLQRSAQVENQAQSELAIRGATLRYREGAGDYLAVTEAQRTLTAANEQFSQYRLARLQAVVALCKALGGGWETPRREE
ncbi:MAG: efflux transporter outer membrane subunit [Pseudomonadota bacterium]